MLICRKPDGPACPCPDAMPATSLAAIDFWFDFSSPYSYIANEWIDAVAARHGRTVRRHAILLGATFQAAELKPPVAYPLKGVYALRDFARSARFEGLPYTPPPEFPLPTQNAARVFWWLLATQGEAAAARWATAGLRGVFTQALALHQPGGLAALAAAQGLDADTVQAVCADAVWKARLKQANDEAIAGGVFGAPFFKVDGEPFWGNDRRAQIERWLAQGPF
jgi:2-hydroxychromene-2-carboxylate isomerase